MQRVLKNRCFATVLELTVPKACKCVWMVWACSMWVYVQMCGRACGQTWCMSGFECVCMCGRELLGQTKNQKHILQATEPPTGVPCKHNVGVWAWASEQVCKCM